ncbi:glutamine synthetase family protein [soil metagenome]
MTNRRVRTFWCDLNGLAHGRYLPASRLGEHTHHAVTTLVMGIDGEIQPVDGYSADVGFPDMTATVEPATLRRGWEPDTDVAIAALTSGPGPVAICPRNALTAAVAAWRELGFEPYLGYEIEFYVFESDDHAPGGWRPARGPAHRVYGTGPFSDPTGLLLDYFDTVEAMDLGLEGVMAEFSPGQMEINLRYQPAVEATDRAFLCREMVREVAAGRGYLASFLGRPDAMMVGSGLHVNLSFTSVGNDDNALADPSDPDGLSPMTRTCIAGLLDHHEAIAGWSAPLVNSFKRLRPGLIAGYWANWGLDNRTSTYRVPGQRGAGTRIENRMPCGTANPYLAAAAMLHACRLGHLAGATCPEPQAGDGDGKPNTDRHAPHTLPEAIAALEADTDLGAAMCADRVRAFVALRRYELGRWEASGEPWDPETIGAWELESYLPYY